VGTCSTYNFKGVGPGLPLNFGADKAGDRLWAALARTTTAMACHHRQDQIVQKGTQP
jgi:hypothetical protein